MDLVRLIKKNSALLLPAGITLAAVLLFVPVLLAGRAVQSQMGESVSLGRQVNSLIARTVPTNQYVGERAYQQEHARDANMIDEMARQTSERELLAYGMFPEPNETSTIIFTNFGKAYRKAIEEMVLSLKARDCPSEAEIAEATRQGTSEGMNRYQASSVTVQAGSRNEKIVEQLCMDRAESAPVYASPEIFSGYNYWDNYNYIGRKEAIEDCWRAQLAYWIQKDIVDAIAAVDKDSSSVFKSPVKRLLSISFSGEYGDSSGRLGTPGMADMPRYATQTEGILTIPWTGRVSDSDIDVVHFSCSVIASDKGIQPFMRELCSQRKHIFKGWNGLAAPQEFVHSQITILKSSVEPILRSTTVMADRYRYGDEAAVQLNLVCEYIFNKAGYAKVRPTLGAEAATAAAPGISPPPQPRPPRQPRSSTSSDGSNRSTRGRLGEDLP
jgi:hypothetical protein